MTIKSEVMAELLQKVAEKSLRPGTWVVCEVYEFHEGPGGRYIQAPVQTVAGERVEPEQREYQPLLKHSDLFLSFARLADNGGLDKILSWRSCTGSAAYPKTVARMRIYTGRSRTWYLPAWVVRG